MSVKIDKSKVSPPEIFWTDQALWELWCLMVNDYTLKNQGLRIFVREKGCEGFTFGLGFHQKKDPDFELQLDIDATSFKQESFKENALELNWPSISIPLYIDPFCAFYLKRAKIEFERDLAGEREGFIVKALENHKFYGKFWIKKADELPPTSD